MIVGMITDSPVFDCSDSRYLRGTPATRGTNTPGSLLDGGRGKCRRITDVKCFGSFLSADIFDDGWSPSRTDRSATGGFFRGNAMAPTLGDRRRPMDRHDLYIQLWSIWMMLLVGGMAYALLV